MAGLLEWHHMITWENESSNDDDHDGKPHWFSQPFHHPGNMFGDKSGDAPCASDSDENDISANGTRLSGRFIFILKLKW